jgi:hypothetical protein
MLASGVAKCGTPATAAGLPVGLATAVTGAGVGGVGGVEAADVADAAAVTGAVAVIGAVAGAVKAAFGAATVVGLALVGVPTGCAVGCVAAVRVDAARSAAVCEPHAASRTPSAQAAPIAAVVFIVVVVVRWPFVLFIDPP